MALSVVRGASAIPQIPLGVQNAVDLLAEGPDRTKRILVAMMGGAREALFVLEADVGELLGRLSLRPERGLATLRYVEQCLLQMGRLTAHLAGCFFDRSTQPIMSASVDGVVSTRRDLMRAFLGRPGSRLRVGIHVSLLTSLAVFVGCRLNGLSSGFLEV